MGFRGKLKWTAGPAWSTTLRYGLAVASVAVALGVASVFTHFHLPQTFGVFALSAIAVTFWYAGTKPGILAALLSSVVRDLLFDPQTSTESRLLFDLVFLAFALLMTRVGRERNQLELRVAERTAELTQLNDSLKSEIAKHNQTEAELRRSEAYLAGAQRLSHTGSFGWNVSSGKIHWSEETFKVFDCEQAVEPTLQLVFQRMHPDDRDLVQQKIERATEASADFDLEHRLLMPDGSLKYVHVLARALETSSGDLEFVGAVTDVSERKRAEEALRASENNLRRIVDSVPGLQCALNPAGKIEFANRPLLEYFGKTVEEMDRWSTGDVIHPDDLPRVIDEFTNSMANGTPLNHEFRCRRADGVYRWFQASIFPVRDADGGITGWYALMTDVEDRKRAEEVLRESEAYLAEAQRLSHTGSWAWSPSPGDMRYWSEECYRVQGFDPKGELPRLDRLIQNIHPDDQARVLEVIERAVKNREDFKYDYRIVHPDRGIRHAQSLGHPVFGPSGDLIEYVGTIIDVTERKQAEDKIRQSEAYLAEAQRLSHTGSWAWSPPPGDIRYWSEECFRVQGFDPKEGLPSYEEFFKTIHPDDHARITEVIETAVREREDFEFDYRIVHPGGEIRDARSVGHPVFDPSGDLIEYVGTIIDVTDRRQAEKERERLREAQADLAHVSRMTAMGELTASLAHEVNQPITAAVNGASTCVRWLTREDPDLGEAREAALGVIRNAKRAADIINRIRSISKKGESKRQLADANELILEMIALLRNEAKRHSISVRTELDAELPKVMADSVQVQQVLMNLIMNAIDAMKDVDRERELTIRSQWADNRMLLISVSDTGVGLPPQQADRIFDAFFTTKSHGIGMGLRISRSIVESHGGRLWAADNSPHGASFHFTLSTPVEVGA
jgi:PAS domain S-box-containing protein